MENGESIAERQKKQPMNYDSTVENQSQVNAEALSRGSSPAAPSPEPTYADGLLALRAMDTWSTGGDITSPTITPDLEGPTRALQFGDFPGRPYGAPQTWNFEAMMAMHGGRR
jgi:hypothetical protein